MEEINDALIAVRVHTRASPEVAFSGNVVQKLRRTLIRNMPFWVGEVRDSGEINVIAPLEVEVMSPAKNHGKQIKDDEQYEALRDRGMSKSKAARIANTSRQDAGKRGGQSV